MIRLAFLVGLIFLVYYAIKAVRRQPPRRGGGEIRIMPYCQKCESNRNVVTNRGQQTYYPRDQYPWYCERCEEGF